MFILNEMCFKSIQMEGQRKRDTVPSSKKKKNHLSTKILKKNLGLTLFSYLN